MRDHPGAGTVSSATTHVKRSYRAARRPVGLSKAEVAAFELDRATPDGECRITVLPLYGDGLQYAYVTFGGKRMRLHRLMLEVKIGRELEAGEQANHTCDRTDCIFPGHLYVGSHQENMHDMKVRDRRASTAGERNANAKLSDAQADEIARRYAAGGVTMTALAAEYGVSRSLVSYICHGKRRSSKEAKS